MSGRDYNGSVDVALILLAAFLAGSIPFTQIAARLLRGADLRTVESGTVSGTGLFRVAGFGPMAVAGLLDIGKGAVGPVLAGSGRPELAAVAGGVAVVGHNWSPWLRGAGGRGITTAMGALAVVAWPGSLILLGGMAIGRIFGQTAVGSVVAELALTPVLAWLGWPPAALGGACVAVPMLVKRLVGNTRPTEPGAKVYLTRLVFDRDRYAEQ